MSKVVNRYHAEAPTKLILSGEHSVVYGFPALVMAIDIKVRAAVEVLERRMITVRAAGLGSYDVEISTSAERGDERLRPAAAVASYIIKRLNAECGLEIETWSDAPIAAGLGSSASSFISIAHSCFRALGCQPTERELFEAAMVGERMVHENPSGVDVMIAISGGLMRYSRSSAPIRLDIPTDFSLIVINTGKARRTGDMVSKFRKSLEEGGEVAGLWLKHIGHLTMQIEMALKRGDLQLMGLLMTSNHLALSHFGVSSPELDEIVKESIRCGAFGAKLTGAGGGGSVIALANPESSKFILERMRSLRYECFEAKLSEEGVRGWQG